METKIFGRDDQAPKQGSLFASLGLRSRLVLALMFASLIPLIALYTMGYRAIVQNSSELLRETLEHVASVQKRRVHVELFRLEEALDLLASRTQMRRSIRHFSLTGDPEAKELVERILADALSSSSTLKEVGIRDVHGVRLTRVGGSAQYTSGKEEFVNPSTLKPGFNFVWDNDGLPELWLTRSLELDGEPIGFVDVQASMQGLRSVLDDFPLAELAGQTSLLVTVRGTFDWIMPHQENSAFLRKLSEMNEPEFGAVRSNALYAPLRLDEFILRLHELDRGLGYLVVYSSVAAVDSRLRAAVGSLLVMSALALIPGLVLALMVARMISRPVERLTDAAKDLRDGKQNEPIREHYWGEFAELTSSFNHAAKVITGRTQALYQEIRTRQLAEKQLVDLVNTDNLTGLVNRRFFFTTLKRILATEDSFLAQPAVGPRAVGHLLYLDLDGFKPINDQHGHATGDQVLTTVGRRLANLIREGDVAARLGGDEFALLLLSTNRPPFDSDSDSDSDAVVERIVSTISRPMRIGDQVIRVGCSAGVVELFQGDDPEEVLHRADQAMYDVKRLHRGAKTPNPVSDARDVTPER